MSMRILQVNYGDFVMRPKHGPKQEKTEMRKICIRRVLTPWSIPTRYPKFGRCQSSRNSGAYLPTEYVPS